MLREKGKQGGRVSEIDSKENDRRHKPGIEAHVASERMHTQSAAAATAAAAFTAEVPSSGDGRRRSIPRRECKIGTATTTRMTTKPREKKKRTPTQRM